jgi:hypothetical protein
MVGENVRSNQPASCEIVALPLFIYPPFRLHLDFQWLPSYFFKSDWKSLNITESRLRLQAATCGDVSVPSGWRPYTGTFSFSFTVI